MKRKIFLIIIAILIISIPTAVFILKQQTVFKLGAQTINKPENVQITNITEKSATVSWSTQKATQGVINYGISSTNLTLIQTESSPVINHRVNLINLLPATKYFFVIKIADQTFDNGGQPFTFTTKETGASSSPTPSLEPNLTISPTLSPLTEEGFQSAIGTNNATYDLNKDGIVNTADLLLFRQQQNK